MHYEEVAGESHRLHDVQFKPYSFVHLRGQDKFSRISLLPIVLVSTLVRKLGKIVRLKLDAVEFVVTSQVGNFLFTLFSWQLVLTILIACELLEKLFVREFLPPLLLRSELFGYWEERHDGVVVDAVEFHLVQYLARVGQCLRHISEHLIHLLTCLKPFLFGIEHSCRVVKVFSCGDAEQMVVCFGVLLVHKMRIVGAYQFDAIFACQFHNHLVSLLLQGECLTIGTDGRVFHLMALQFQIIVITENTLVPLYCLAGTCHIACQNLLGNLASNTGRANN